ncbi:hypothetical protein [Cryptosporidium hominis TU502]|uniref:hypothetical protein n=1 Tax=Cryptosporidium hominis (strain TU502) TaxID=353151 RepID=UPI0000452EEC|nr:hypothetical protein [Cryptosporidium hominis TU502]
MGITPTFGFLYGNNTELSSPVIPNTFPTNNTTSNQITLKTHEFIQTCNYLLRKFNWRQIMAIHYFFFLELKIKRMYYKLLIRLNLEVNKTRADF